MELRIFIEPQQGATYDDLLAVARVPRTSASVRSSAPTTISRWAVDGPPGPTDAWVTLAGLARETSTIRLGTLMTSATFRYPGPLAIAVAQVDQMSGGRVELGSVRAGTTPSTRRTASPSRHRRALRPARGAARDHHRSVVDARRARRSPSTAPLLRCGLAGPAQAGQQPHAPIIIGGDGRHPHAGSRGALRRRVQHALRRRRGVGRQFDRVRAACEAIGPRPGDAGLLRRARWCAAATPTSAVQRRAGRSAATPTSCGRTASPARRRRSRDKIGRFADLGAERVYLQVLDLADLDHLDLIATEVMPHV